ncbi:Adenylosuccinate synthetase, partial [Catenaria anguillulae PL171]
FAELEKTEEKGVSCAGRLLVSSRAHLVFDVHQVVDGLREMERGGSTIGTTRKGIGPAYSSKASRSGLRIHHLLNNFDSFASHLRTFIANRKKRYGDFEYDVDAEIQRYREFAERLRPMVTDTVYYMNQSVLEGKRVLVEGANAAMLDIDFGTYPYVTSSNTTIGGVCTGLGLPPTRVNKVIGVVKAYTTRVGGGPFPTEQLNEVGEHLQTVGAEFGVTTGRKRRCGWLDLVVLRYSHLINGYTSINLTKLDVLDKLPEIKIGVTYRHKPSGKIVPSFPADLDYLGECEVEYETLPGWMTDISKCTSWEQLPANAQKYIRRIEELLGGVPVEWVGVGPGREALVSVPARK